MSKKNNKSNKSSRRTRQKRQGDRLPTDIGRVTSTVPRGVVTSYKIRRAWQQEITYAPTSGFFAGGPNLQFNFSGSASEVRIGGVATFGPVLVNSSEFSSLFDQWRINSVTMRFDWNTNSATPAEATLVAPLLFMAPDYDDSGDANVAALLQYPSVRTHSFYQNGYSPLIYTLTPRPLKDVAGTGLLTSYSSDMSKPFIRTAELATPHYGVKIATTPMGATSTVAIGRIFITCYIDLEFTNPK